MSFFGSIPFTNTDFMDAVLAGEDKLDWLEGIGSPSLSATRLFETFPDHDSTSFQDLKLPVSDLEAFDDPDDLPARASSRFTPFDDLMSPDGLFSDPMFPMTAGDVDDDMDYLSSSPFALPVPDIKVTDHDAEAAAELAHASTGDEDQDFESDVFEGYSSDDDADPAADAAEHTAYDEPLTPESATFEGFPPDRDVDEAPSESDFAVSEAGESSSDGDSDSDFKPYQPARSSRPSARQQSNAGSEVSRRRRSSTPISPTSTQHRASAFGSDGHDDSSRTHSTTGGKSVLYTNQLLRNQPATHSATGGKCTTTLIKSLISDVLTEPVSDSEKIALITRLVQDGNADADHDDDADADHDDDADADFELSSNADSDDELDSHFSPATPTRSTPATPHTRPSSRKSPSSFSSTTPSTPSRKHPSTDRFLTPPSTPSRKTTPSPSTPSTSATLRTPTGKAPQIKWQPDEVALIRLELPKIVGAGIKGEERFALVADRLNEAFGDRYVQQHGAGAGRTRSSVKNCVQRIVRARNAAEGVEFDDRMPRKDGKKREVVTSVRANKKGRKRAREESDGDDEIDEEVVVPKRRKRIAGRRAGAAVKQMEVESGSESESELEEGEIVEAPVSPSPRGRSKKLGKKRSEADRMHARRIYMGEYL